jgi:hypothetical protein
MLLSELRGRRARTQWRSKAAEARDAAGAAARARQRKRARQKAVERTDALGSSRESRELPRRSGRTHAAAIGQAGGEADEEQREQEQQEEELEVVDLDCADYVDTGVKKKTRQKKKKRRGEEDGSEERDDDEDDAVSQVELMRAKLAVLEFERSRAQQAKHQRVAKEEKAKRRAKAKVKTQLLLTSSASISVRKTNQCSLCGESLLGLRPFQLDSQLYCSGECLRSMTRADDESVARRAGVTALSWDAETTAITKTLHAGKVAKERARLRTERERAELEVEAD